MRKLAQTLTLVALLGCSDGTAPTPKPKSQPPTVNNPPIVYSTPSTIITENENYLYDVDASDHEGRPLTYSLTKKPSWLSIDPITGMITGQAPEIVADTSYEVEIEVSDGEKKTIQSYSLLNKNLLNTYLLSQAQTDSLQLPDSNTIVFHNPTTYLVNDLIAAGITEKTPEGLLRRITSISSDKKTVQTAQASLEDFVKTEDIFFQKSLVPANASMSALRGVAASNSAGEGDFNFGISLNNVVLYDHDGNENTTHDRFIANGNFNFDLDFLMNLKTENHTARYLKFQQVLQQSSDITLGSNVLGIASTIDVKIAEYAFAPLILGYLPTPVPIPVVVTPKVGIYASLDPTHINPLSLNIKQNSTISAGIEFLDGTWRDLSDFSTDFEFSFLNPVQGNWDLAFYAGPRLSLPFYGIVGPNASLNARLRLASQNNHWQLYGGLISTLGVNAGIFGRQISAYAKKVIDYEKLLAQSDTISQPPTTDSTFTDARDGKIYKIIKIGDQTWMAENLNYAAVGSDFYDGNQSNGPIYGRLYPWGASKTACPAGWHLPSDAEWNALYTSLGGKNVPGTGGKLKSIGTLEAGTGRWRAPNVGATNSSRFSAQPGGRLESGTFSEEGFRAYFWANTEPFALAHILHYDSGMAGSTVAASNPEGLKFSIRCLKN